MVTLLFHSISLKKEGNLNFVGLLTPSLCMSGLANLALKDVSEKISGDQSNLSLLKIFVKSFYQTLPYHFIASTLLSLLSSSSCSTWFFPCFSFILWYSFLLACLGNPIFLVGVIIVSHLFHATCIKEEGDPKFIWSPHSFPIHGWDFQFGLASHVRKSKWSLLRPLPT
jgi:hypothetical protein